MHNSRPDPYTQAWLMAHGGVCINRTAGCEAMRVNCKTEGQVGGVLQHWQNSPEKHMKYTEHAINVLAAKTYRNIGRAWIVKNLSAEAKVASIVSLINGSAKEGQPASIDDFATRKEKIKQRLNNLAEFVDSLVAIGDADFPPYRGNVKNSEQPIFLFYRGNLSLLKSTSKNVAVIGLLDPDNDTKIIEQEVVNELVKNGASVVSGLALGCDTIAHRQTLDANGKTIAILPSPLNNIMPAKNKALAKEIIEKDGLLISEYYVDAQSKMELRGRYQERDRLQALFSDSIILSASYAKNDQGNDSGSRLAMAYALNYSIPRAVIYDPEINANNPKYDLSRQLMSEQKDLTVINTKNLSEAVIRIVSNKPHIDSNTAFQPSLFG